MTPEQEAAQEPVGAIGRKAGRGLRWSILGNVATKAGSFAMSLVLARLLVPEDYGLYAIALAASQFLIHINDAGILAATVQWRGKLEDMAPTATIMAFVFSTAVYGIFWAVAPYYAQLSGSASATPVIRLLTLIILIDGITAVRAGALMRRFQQDRLTMANVAGFCVQAVVSISLAAGGAGAFSFAWGQVASNTVTAVLVLAFARMPFTFRIDRAVAVHLLKFGMPLAVSLGIEALLVNVDKVVIGDALGAAVLGYYMVAFNVSSWVPGMIGTAVRYVSLPSFSRLAEEDPESLSAGVQRSVPVMIAFVLPFALLMAVLSPALVVFLYGAQWAPAAAALQFLSVVMIVRMLVPLAFDILTALGATRSTVWLNLSWCVALIPALIIGTRLDGVRGASMAQAAVGLLVTIPLGALALHRAGVRLRPIVPALVRPLAGAAVAAPVMILLSHVTGGIPLVQLVVAGGAGVAAFVLIVVPRAQFRQLGGRLMPARAR
jgi:O-antigen/teichoic acid export membrane protein